MAAGKKEVEKNKNKTEVEKNKNKKGDPPKSASPNVVYTRVTILIIVFTIWSSFARFPELGIDSAFSTFFYNLHKSYTCPSMLNKDGSPNIECIIARRELHDNLAILMTGNSMTNVKRFTIPVEENVSVSFIVYRPMPRLDDEILPVTLYMHGGGFTVGSAKNDDSIARTLADMSKTLVVNIDYALAPEHPYPAAINDVMAVYNWVRGEGASIIGGDPTNISITGESAGGQLAAVISLMLAEKEDNSNLCLTGLVSPKLDKGCQFPSCTQYDQAGYLCSLTEVNEYMALYHPKEPLPESEEYKLYPLLASGEILSRLNTHHTITAEADIIRDEAEEYAEKLARFGVKSTLQRYDRTVHGFFGKPFTKGTKSVYDLAMIIRDECINNRK